MNKYLIELLRLQSSVILPGFGSLMIGNAKTGKIVFNPHLKFNDGALAKYISEKDGIDKQAAQNQIAKFVREIEAELGKGNSFDIFQFGKFTKKSDGTIDFLQEGIPVAPDTLASATTAKKPTVEIKKPTETKLEPVVETKKEELKSADVKPTVTSNPTDESSSLLDKLKASQTEAEKKSAEPTKVVEEKTSKTEESIVAQGKNSFVPSADKPKVEEKIAAIDKVIPLADASKKDPAAQDKNIFKPAEKVEPVVEKVVPKTEEKVQAAADVIKANTAKPDVEKLKSADIKPEVKKVEGDSKQLEKSDTSKGMSATKEKFRKDKPQKIKHENPEAKKPKKKKRWVLWFILIIIIGGGTAAGWFYKDKINEFLHSGVGDHDTDSTHANTEPHDSTALASHEEPIMEDSSTTDVIAEEITEEPITEVIEEPVVNHSSPGGTYHIIGNAFSSEKNAENYVNKMKEKGYSAQNIGKYNGLYLVSLKSFGSKEEAKNNLSSVKADAEGAYVMKGK